MARQNWRDIKPENVQRGDKIRVWCWETMDWQTVGRMNTWTLEALKKSASPRRPVQIQRLECD
jgi:hypothetical protein